MASLSRILKKSKRNPILIAQHEMVLVANKAKNLPIPFGPASGKERAIIERTTNNTIKIAS